MTKLALVLGAVGVTVISMGWGAPASGRSTPANVPDASDVDWRAAVALHEKGRQLQEQERQFPGDVERRARRQRTFAQAARHLRTCIKKWSPAPDDLITLKLYYQMGLYLQLSGDQAAAQRFYVVAGKHPLLRDPRAEYNGKPLATELEGRRRELQSNLPSERRVKRVSFSHQKGSIDIPDKAPGKDHRPLTDEEAVRVALRRAALSEAGAGMAQGRMLLGAQFTREIAIAAVDGMVVFGIGGSLSDAQHLGQRLASVRSELIGTYFDSGVEPPLLQVFANLERGDGEFVGAKLSTALHFRSMENAEGYYEALDHSLVLRKGLRECDGGWCFGTAIHELVHALVHADFGDAPAWLDEGLAALYEERGAAGPLDNYRLYYVQHAVRTSRLPPLADLLSATSDRWVTEARLMVATARYFALYLMTREPEFNGLRAVYQRLRSSSVESQDSEATAKALEAVTRLRLADIERDFARFIASRHTTVADRRWDYLKSEIERYVEHLPARPPTK